MQNKNCCIYFSQTGIEDDIDEIDANSSTTDYDIPALVLKCKIVQSQLVLPYIHYMAKII